MENQEEEKPRGETDSSASEAGCKLVDSPVAKLQSKPQQNPAKQIAYCLLVAPFALSIAVFRQQWAWSTQ